MQAHRFLSWASSLAADEFCSKHLSRLLMQGSGFESSLPPGNTCVPLCRPSQKVRVHPDSMAAVRCGIGEGAESGAGPCRPSRDYCGSETDRQSNGVAAVWLERSCGRGFGVVSPTSVCAAAAGVDLPKGVWRQLDNQADPPPPDQDPRRRKRSCSKGT